MPEPWLPDYMARWYDEFCAGLPYGDLERWEGGGGRILTTWRTRLKKNPHVTAAQMEEFIHSEGPSSVNERRFHALRVASNVFNDMGFRTRKEDGKDYTLWRELRQHWVRNGNLLRDGEGLLLPRESPSYAWSWNLEPAAHTVENWFRHFVRWRPLDHPNLKIRVTVLPLSLVPALDGPIKVAVVPLVASISDFKIVKDDSDPTYPRFSVALKSPDVIAFAAVNALKLCAAQRCDIVVFPELCFTPQIQHELQERLRVSTGCYPWLIVAGSARTPARGGAATAHYNQAVVFESQGKLVLTHHKLHRYLMDVSQQERYGVHQTLGQIDRIEDMEIMPYEIEILDTAAGRLAVLICEDLSVEGFVERLVVKLGLDWLLVPILDGCQMQDRWPTRFGRKYAERGACVVVATSLSLVRRHIESLDPAPPPGVGLLLVPTSTGPATRILESSEHGNPATADVE